MKLKKLLIIIIILVICITFLACCNSERTPLAWQEMPENTNTNLKYFGYYHFSDKIAEVAALGNSNIAKIDAKDIEEVAALIDNGFDIFIMIRHIFFNGDNLYEDYLEKWENAKIELAPYMEHVIGFYVDEPYWNGKTINAFHTACQTVRADYPDKKMMAVLAYLSVSLAPLNYFDYCTDLGYDYYESWNAISVEKKINSLINTRATNNQDIWLIPKSFYAKEDHELRIQENLNLEPGVDIENWIKGSYTIAINNPRITGIFAYHYEGNSTDIALDDFFDEGSEYYNQNLKDIYIQIGKTIIANNK